MFDREFVAALALCAIGLTVAGVAAARSMSMGFSFHSSARRRTRSRMSTLSFVYSTVAQGSMMGRMSGRSCRRSYPASGRSS